MMKTAVFLAIAALFLSALTVSFPTKNANALSAVEHVYEDTVVFSRMGTGLNVSLTTNPAENKVHESVVSFSLRIREPFSNWNDIVYPDGYHVNPVTLDYYLVSGIILDYDVARAIDALWVYWGDSGNKTHVEEERSVYLHTYDVEFSKSEGTYFGVAVLPVPSQGVHNLTAWVRAEFNQVTTYDPLWIAFSKTITFTVDTVAPNVTILAQENSIFEKPEVLLNFASNEPHSRIEYCLDGQDNMTIGGNTTLRGLAGGNHNVTVYVTDEAGNTGASETITFTIAEHQPITTTLLIGSVIVVTVIGLGLLVCLKKRQRNKSP